MLINNNVVERCGTSRNSTATALGDLYILFLFDENMIIYQRIFGINFNN